MRFETTVAWPDRRGGYTILRLIVESLNLRQNTRILGQQPSTSSGDTLKARVPPHRTRPFVHVATLLFTEGHVSAGTGAIPGELRRQHGPRRGLCRTRPLRPPPLVLRPPSVTVVGFGWRFRVAVEIAGSFFPIVPC